MIQQSTRFQAPERIAIDRAGDRSRESILYFKTGGALLRVVGVALLAFTALIFLAPDSRAQESVCLDREKLAQTLDGRYSEKPVAAGLDSAGKLLEVFASGDGASWTMTVTTPEGISCVIATGEQWLSDIKPLPDPTI